MNSLNFELLKAKILRLEALVDTNNGSLNTAKAIAALIKEIPDFAGEVCFLQQEKVELLDKLSKTLASDNPARVTVWQQKKELLIEKAYILSFISEYLRRFKPMQDLLPKVELIIAQHSSCER